MSMLRVEHSMNDWACPRNLGGISVSAPKADQALGHLHNIMMNVHPAPQALLLAFCNAHVVNLAADDPVFRSALSGMLVLPDGIGVDLGSRLIYGAPFPANLNGTDFIPGLISTSPVKLRIGLLGAKDGVAKRAAAALIRLDARHDIIVLGHGFFDAAEEQAILAQLKTAPVDLLLVAFGNPRQEIWLARNINAEHARVAVGVGALFDFLAGEVARAPLWLQKMRLEWVYRLLNEPGRLFRRYVMGNPVFMARMLRQKWQARQ